ncbi:hypothetical protein HYX07_02515 [Candidatus Woesearchaeota archaeon]|nr:hypothetical protein [Candidatus Woesearchaeota archaeon]
MSENRLNTERAELVQRLWKVCIAHMEVATFEQNNRSLRLGLVKERMEAFETAFNRLNEIKPDLAVQYKPELDRYRAWYSTEV